MQFMQKEKWKGRDKKRMQKTNTKRLRIEGTTGRVRRSMGIMQENEFWTHYQMVYAETKISSGDVQNSLVFWGTNGSSYPGHKASWWLNGSWHGLSRNLQHYIPVLTLLRRVMSSTSTYMRKSWLVSSKERK